MAGLPTQARRFANPVRLGTALFVLLLLGITVEPALATHFRYGHVTWKPVTAPANTVDFTVQGVWRRDAYGAGPDATYGSQAAPNGSFAENACVNTSRVRIPCTGPNNYAGVGDIIFEGQGNTVFDFGDGSTDFGTTITPADGTALLYLVTSIDPVNNWLFGLALDHTSLPGTIDTTIRYTYSTAAQRTAMIEDCCRISACTSPNAHLNNPDNGYRVTTVVDFASPDSSPVSSVPPIVLCPAGGSCSFDIPVSDNEGDTVNFSLATSTEMNVATFNPPGTGPGLGQPGTTAGCTNDASVDLTSGIYSWNSASCRLASSPGPNPPAGGCNNGSLHTLYSTQVFVEETAKPASSAVDFLVELIPVCPTSIFNQNDPEFITPPTPLCGTSRSGGPGIPMTFTVEADDADAGDSVTLNGVGLPAGAAMAPLLPTSGSPVSSVFTWTPSSGQLGQHVITFTATDQCSTQTLCSIAIDVSNENCTNLTDDDGDGDIDCADQDCNGTPCDDGNFCTVSDTCNAQTGMCGSGPANECSDGNDCTADSCDEGNNVCVHTNQTGTSCSDGSFCTENDTCSAGTCIPGGARSCADGNSCTSDVCDEANDECDNDNLMNGTGCEDGDFCTVSDSCQSGSCTAGTARDCADSTTCTTDTCNEGTNLCDHTAVTSNTPCDDGAFCTTGDSCQAGSCSPGPATDCSDGNACTTDTCNEGTNQCDHPAVANNAPCEDGAFCTISDSCQSGSCTAGPATDCNDNNTCTTDSCNEGTNQCDHPAVANNTPCEDGAFCSSGDSCQSGSCTAGPATDCNDNNTCTTDSCNEGTNQCDHPAVANNTPCEDGAFCSSGDSCQSGSCSTGPPTNCDDSNTCTTDSCNEGTNQCDHPAVANNTPCDDGAFCTTGDSCQSGSCAAGPPTDCTDTSDCTVDSCDEVGDVCVHDGAPLEAQSCDDGLYCTVGETCQSGSCSGAARDCSDSNPCTADNCDENANQCTNNSGPAASCHRSGRASLLIKDAVNPKLDRVVWRWVRGSTPVADVGDPVNGSTSYTLCVYDESADGATTSLALSTTIPAGGTCANGKPCWKKFGATTTRRLRYRDRDSNGARRMSVKPNETGLSRLVFVARGDRVPSLPAPAGPGLLSQDNRVRVQMVNSAGKCWEAEYNTPAVRNRTNLFRDKCGSGIQGTCP